MTQQREIRVVVVDDHLMVRKGVEMVLRSDDMAVVGVAERVAEARALVERRLPDVALVDVGLAEGDCGVELASAIATEVPQVRVLLYTGGASDPDLLRRAVKSGAAGLALKAGSPGELLEAVRSVANGGSYFDPRLGKLLKDDSPEPKQTVLSARECEVLTLLGHGLNGEQIAAELVLSPETIRTHVRNAMGKLQANTRVHALALALQGDEIEL